MSLFIGRLNVDTSNKDLEDLFYDYGAITRCEVKKGKGYGFVEFKDKRDADDAIREQQGATLLGNRIIVEWAKGEKGARRERSERDRDSDSCFICQKSGHWARDCPDRDRRKDRDHRSSRRSPRRSRSRSRSPRRRYSRSPARKRSRSRSPKRRDSRSPRRRDSRSPDRKKRDSRSPKKASSRSPKRSRRSPSPSKDKKRERSKSPSPSKDNGNGNGNANGRERDRSRSPSPRKGSKSPEK